MACQFLVESFAQLLFFNNSLIGSSKSTDKQIRTPGYPMLGIDVIQSELQPKGYTF
jgi:hypothetical protein